MAQIRSIRKLSITNLAIALSIFRVIEFHILWYYSTFFIWIIRNKARVEKVHNVFVAAVPLLHAVVSDFYVVVCCVDGIGAEHF